MSNSSKTLKNGHEVSGTWCMWRHTLLVPVYEVQTLQMAPIHRPYRVAAPSAFYWKKKGNRESATLCSYFGILQILRLLEMPNAVVRFPANSVLMPRAVATTAQNWVVERECGHCSVCYWNTWQRNIWHRNLWHWKVWHWWVWHWHTRHWNA